MYVHTHTGAETYRRTLTHTSGVQYTKFSYHDKGAIGITIRYISRYAPVV